MPSKSTNKRNYSPLPLRSVGEDPVVKMFGAMDGDNKRSWMMKSAH
ncbi:MAG: hypothetical protein R6V33_02235 [Pelovirga sp.]